MKLTFYAFVAFILTSCTVGPNYSRPADPLPCHYTTSIKKSSRWYHSLRDPLLTKLIQQALCYNQDIQKALANIRQARAELGIAQGNFLPQLDALSYVNRDRLSANSELISSFPPGLVPLSYTDYHLFEFDASWEIDLFGHTRRAVEAAWARFQSQLENQNNVMIAVAAEVARNYVKYRVYQQRILLTNRTIHSYLDTVRLVDLQRRAGFANRIDLQRVQSELFSAKSALPSLQAEARATLAALAVLVGELPECLFQELKDFRPIPTVSPCMLAIGLPSDLLCARPDIRLAERKLAAATADIGVAVSNMFPRFQLIGNLGSDTVFPGTYFDKASIFWSAGPQVSIPLFHGCRLRNAVIAEEAMRDAALAEYRKKVLQALADVESSLIRYEREQVRHRELFISYKKLKSVRGLIKIQYRDGQTNLLDVLDAERQLNSIQDQYAQSTGQVTIDLISLYKSLGGNWIFCVT